MIEPLSSSHAGLWFPKVCVALVLFFKRRWEWILIKFFTFDLRDTWHTRVASSFQPQGLIYKPPLSPLPRSCFVVSDSHGVQKARKMEISYHPSWWASGSSGDAVLATDLATDLTHALSGASFKPEYKDFSGGPVVRTPWFNRRGNGFNPWSGN